MKKRLSLIIILIFIATLFSFSLAACTTQGKSAYEIACKNGFVGTEAEWLASLRGTDGYDGRDGQDGRDSPILDIDQLFEAYLLKYPDADFSDFLQSLSIVGYNNAEYAAAKGIQSIVSIYSTFTKNVNLSDISSQYSGAGSGVVYRIEDGYVYIITNYHVIYDKNSTTANGIAKSIQIYTYGFESSQNAVEAQFFGGSITKDIAVLKAPLSSFSSYIRAVEIADSNDISFGEGTIAIGNPMAEGISVSAGIVSIDSEYIEMEALDYTSQIVMRIIRTDTAVNKGNSGGGLFNMHGQLIGIVNAKIISSDIENIGYAIPSNVAIGIAECIIGNDAKKCILGVTISVIETQTYYNTAKNKVEVLETMSVESVDSDSLALGKLQQGDNLISVRINDGEIFAITRLFHLSDFLYKVRSSDIIYLEIERNNITTVIEISLETANFMPV